MYAHFSPSSSFVKNKKGNFREIKKKNKKKNNNNNNKKSFNSGFIYIEEVVVVALGIA
jgi:hypothetical protein